MFKNNGSLPLGPHRCALRNKIMTSVAFIRFPCCAIASKRAARKSGISFHAAVSQYPGRNLHEHGHGRLCLQRRPVQVGHQLYERRRDHVHSRPVHQYPRLFHRPLSGRAALLAHHPEADHHPARHLRNARRRHLHHRTRHDADRQCLGHPAVAAARRDVRCRTLLPRARRLAALVGDPRRPRRRDDHHPARPGRLHARRPSLRRERSDDSRPRSRNPLDRSGDALADGHRRHRHVGRLLRCAPRSPALGGWQPSAQPRFRTCCSLRSWC